MIFCPFSLSSKIFIFVFRGFLVLTTFVSNATSHINLSSFLVYLRKSMFLFRSVRVIFRILLQQHVLNASVFFPIFVYLSKSICSSFRLSMVLTRVQSNDTSQSINPSSVLVLYLPALVSLIRIAYCKYYLRFSTIFNESIV